MSSAIVTTLRDAGPSLDSFVRYHLAIGFDRIYLFFDDPSDSDAARIEAHRDVVVTRSGTALQSAWTKTASYPLVGPYVGTEVMARQCLNAEVAIQQAQRDGIDWLLHIDADELFYLDGFALDGHFSQLDDAGVRGVVYLNHEVLVDRYEVTDCFKELRHFKINPALRRPSAGPGPSKRFLCYTNGKGAGRVGPGLIANGVHGFWNGEPGAEAVTATVGPRILHYCNAGFDQFWRKYHLLGDFADTWYGKAPVLRFHLAARDALKNGGAEVARLFYREQVWVPPEEIARLHTDGHALRIDEPSRILAG
jgi:hypothetical protein